MSEAKMRFDIHLREGTTCLENFDSSGHEFTLRHVWITCVSTFDLYMTELISEAGLRWIDRSPPVLTSNLRQVHVPLFGVLDLDNLSPTEKLIFYKEHVYAAVQYTSFYRPEKVSEALSYIWICPAKEKWARILCNMRKTGRYSNRDEHDIRSELTQIGDRRDLIAHSADKPPGAGGANPVNRIDAAATLEFIADLATAIDVETEAQLRYMSETATS